MNPIKRITSGNNRYSVGVGYVVIPDEVDRLLYVKKCYRTSTVAIISEDGEFIPECSITSHVISDIDFPIENIDKTTNQINLGSAVVYLNEPLHNKAIIIGIVPKKDEVLQNDENEFFLFKSTKNGSVFINGNANLNQIGISIDGLEKKSTLNIDVTDVNDESELNINVSGKTKIINSKELNLTSKEKVTFCKGNEPLLLGQKTVDFLTDFINEVSSITVVTAIGTQPIVNKLQVENLKNKLEDLKSKLTFTE